MVRRAAVLVALLLLLIALVTAENAKPLGDFLVSSSTPVPEGFSTGIRYLAETQFVDALNLCRESQINPHDVWLANDNIYAYYLLNKIGHPFAALIKSGLDGFGYWSNGKAELVLNKTLDTYRSSADYDLASVYGYRIRVEVHNGSEMPDKEEYADICFWWSYNMLLKKDEREAERWWDKGFQLYNGTGFKDTAFDEEKGFDTYKLGLCLWTARQINYTENGDFHRPGLARLEDDMWQMQSKLLGGFYTAYDKDHNPVNSSTNTETTILCLMSYTVPQVTPPPTFPDSVLMLVIIGVVAIGMVSLQIMRRCRWGRV